MLITWNELFLAVDRNSHEEEIANQKRFMSRYLENADRFIYQTLTKKQSQDTITKFIKTYYKIYWWKPYWQSNAC